VAVDLVGEASLPVHRTDVVDHIDAGDCCRKRRIVAQIAGGERDAGRRKVARTIGVADERAHLVTARGEEAREMASRESGGAGDWDTHRSATSETGEPKRLSRPKRSSVCSLRSVNAREPIALCNAIGRTN